MHDGFDREAGGEKQNVFCGTEAYIEICLSSIMLLQCSSDHVHTIPVCHLSGGSCARR